MALTKADVARSLAKHHFQIEDGLLRVRIISTGANDADEPIKLLEVNANTFPTGSIEPISFAPTAEVPFVTEIAEISPDEYAQLMRGQLILPRGWTLDDDDDDLTRAA
jgi:hypothetical protein